jgi:hypothetical protein
MSKFIKVSENYRIKWSKEENKLYKKWIGDHEIIKETQYPEWLQLSSYFDNRINRYKYVISDLPPYNDHAYLYKDIDDKRYYVYQPYIDNTDSENDEISDWAEQRGLHVEILPNNKSWHLKGRTIVVILTLDDEEKLIEYFNTNIRKRDK